MRGKGGKKKKKKKDGNTFTCARVFAELAACDKHKCVSIYESEERHYGHENDIRKKSRRSQCDSGWKLGRISILVA